MNFSIDQQETVIADVVAERSRQDKKWGQQNHRPFPWVAILAKEVGELAQASLNFEFGSRNQSNFQAMRDEAVQVAAVAVALVECLDRSRLGSNYFQAEGNGQGDGAA